MYPKCRESLGIQSYVSLYLTSYIEYNLILENFLNRELKSKNQYEGGKGQKHDFLDRNWVL